MKIENYGSGARCETVMQELISRDTAGLLPAWLERVILLPIPAARDGVHITGTDRLVSEVLMDIEAGDFVAGYGIPDEDVEIIRAAGGVCFDAAHDERFLGVNAELTALGALGHILTEARRAPSELTVGIVGYGRIGSRLADKLLYLGARLVIYTSRRLTRLTLGEYGVRTLPLEAGEPLEGVSSLDLLVNTAPTDLSASFPEGRIPDGLTVIELASGNNFSGVAGVVRLPSVPDRCYPRTAARAYLEAILAALEGVRV